MADLTCDVLQATNATYAATESAVQAVKMANSAALEVSTLNLARVVTPLNISK